MRYIKYFLFIFITITLISACGKKEHKNETPEELLRPASMEYTRQDTSNINYLVNTYVSNFGKGNLDECANMLYTYHNNNVVPYSEAKKDSFKTAFSHFHIYGSVVKDMILRSDRNNQVDIAIQIVRNGNLEKGIGVTTLSLNPVYVNGTWYLTLLDKDAEGVKDVYQTDNN